MTPGTLSLPVSLYAFNVQGKQQSLESRMNVAAAAIDARVACNIRNESELQKTVEVVGFAPIKKYAKKSKKSLPQVSVTRFLGLRRFGATSIP